MHNYIGTKQIKAQSMTRAAYYTYRGWDLLSNENGNDEGYLVEYLDDGKPNHPDHAGYISWSPKEVFEATYRQSGEMSFGHAVELAKQGLRVARKGWNGKGMWLALVQNGSYDVACNVVNGPNTNLSLAPWLGMKTADNQFVPWLASQTDVLANDWCVVS